MNTSNENQSWLTVPLWFSLSPTALPGLSHLVRAIANSPEWFIALEYLEEADQVPGVSMHFTCILDLLVWWICLGSCFGTLWIVLGTLLPFVFFSWGTLKQCEVFQLIYWSPCSFTDCCQVAVICFVRVCLHSRATAQSIPILVGLLLRENWINRFRQLADSCAWTLQSSTLWPKSAAPGSWRLRPRHVRCNERKSCHAVWMTTVLVTVLRSWYLVT